MTTTIHRCKHHDYAHPYTVCPTCAHQYCEQYWASGCPRCAQVRRLMAAPRTVPAFADCLASLQKARPAWERQENIPEYADYDASLDDGTLVRLMIPADDPAAAACLVFRFFDGDVERLGDHVQGTITQAAAQELLAGAEGA